MLLQPRKRYSPLRLIYLNFNVIGSFSGEFEPVYYLWHLI